MIEAVAKIREDMHNRLLDLRALNRILESDSFEEAYKKASIEQILVAKVHIRCNKPAELREWVRRRLKSELEHMNYDELREMASIQHITRYSYMSKAELLKALKDRANGPNSK